MKILPNLNRSLIAILTVALCGVGILFGQNPPEKKDPYTREAAGKNTDPATAEPDTNLLIGLQFIEMLQEDVLAGEKEELADNQWRDFAKERIAEGSARIVDSLAMVAKSGRRTKLESALQLHCPKDRVLLPFDSSGPFFPTAFEVEPVGTVFEVDTRFDAAGGSVDVHFSLQVSRHRGETPGSRVPNERLLETDVMNPLLQAQHVITRATIGIGESQLLTKLDLIDSNGNGEKKEAVLLVFLRCDIMEVDSAVGPEKAEGAGNELSLRSSVIEVPSETWHNWLSGMDLSGLFDGGAWARVEKQLAEKKPGVSVIASPKLRTPGGSRAKAHIGEKLDYAGTFDEPKEKGARAAPGGFRTRELGTLWELDPMLASTGRADVNQVIEVSSMHGYSISYRADVDGEWQPAVQFPRFFTSKFTGQVTVAPDGDMLVAVGTPAGEEGTPDLSKKLLFFLHHDTFNQP